MLIFLFLLAACGTERGLRDAPTEVTYGGWIYDSPLYEGVFADGTVTFTLPADVAEEPVAAEQPYEGYDGYWLATLPPSTPLQLRIAGEGAWPSVWAGDSPGADGAWFAGVVFAADQAYVDAMLLALDLPEGVVPGALADGAVHLWGAPLDGADWDCAAVRVNGAAPVCYTVAEDGVATRVTEGPFDLFYAFDLAPGEVVLEDGFGGRETWTAAAGELVMAWSLVHI